MMAQEAFAKMYQHLHLFTRKAKLMSWSMKDLTTDYSDIFDQLTIGSSKILDRVQWSRTSTHLYREDLICVPKACEETMLEWAHKTDGHPGVERTLWFFQKCFLAQSSYASLKKVLSKIIAEFPCTKAKANTAADRGEVRNLPIPNQMNSILYVDFMESPKCAGHDFALLVTDPFSRYSRVFPLTEKVDGEGVLKEIFEGWVQIYGLPKIIHSDQDIRFTSPTGWYRSVIRAMGTEVQFGTPYLRTKNPLCERRIGCFKTVMRILMLSEKSRNWLKHFSQFRRMMRRRRKRRMVNCPLGWRHWKHACAVLRTIWLQCCHQQRGRRAMLQTKRQVKNGASIRFQFQILLHIPNCLQIVM